MISTQPKNYICKEDHLKETIENCYITSVGINRQRNKNEIFKISSKVLYKATLFGLS